MRRVLPVVLGALALPAPAQAACAPLPFSEQVDGAEVVIVGRALDGPLGPGGTLLSPARFRVERLERGPVEGDEVRVETGTREDSVISIGPHPRPGERFRLFAVLRQGGTLDANDCRGTRRLDGPVLAPRLSLAGRSGVTPRRSDLTGRTARRAPRVATGRSELRVVSTRRLELLRVLRAGRVVARGRSTDGRRWTIAVPRGTTRLVADTGEGAFAVALQR